jgi:2,4-dienoyl-CoA reductase (NADPH2)
MKKVQFIGGVRYEKIDDKGIHMSVNKTRKVLEVDHIVLCAGQNPVTDLVEPLQRANMTFDVIGGAALAAEIDAKRAIREGFEAACKI